MGIILSGKGCTLLFSCIHWCTAVLGGSLILLTQTSHQPQRLLPVGDRAIPNCVPRVLTFLLPAARQMPVFNWNWGSRKTGSQGFLSRGNTCRLLGRAASRTKPLKFNQGVGSGAGNLCSPNTPKDAEACGTTLGKHVSAPTPPVSSSQC